MHARPPFALSLMLAAALSAPAAASPSHGEFVDATCTAEGWEPAMPFNPNGGDPNDPTQVNCALCHTDLEGDPNSLTDGGFLFLMSSYTDVSGFCAPPPPDTNAAPSFIDVGPQSLTVGVPFSLNLTASDPDLDMMMLTMSNGPAGSTFTDLGSGRGRFRWTPTESQVGNHMVTFHVADTGTPMKVGSLDVSLTVAGLAVNHPPVLAPIGNQHVEVGSELSITLSATDEDGDALQFGAIGLPAGASLTGSEFRFAPLSTQVGNHDVTFMVTDSASPPAADSEPVTITVGETNHPPVLAPIGNRNLVAGESMQIALAASDPDGDPLALSCAGLPADAVFNDLGNGTGTIDWSPTAAGSWPVNCTVSDDGVPPLTAGEMFSLTASEPPVSGPEPVLEEARWIGGGVLWVRGHSEVASGKQLVAIHGVADDGSPYLLGTGMSSGKGRFTIELRPFVAPCQVMAEVEGVSGDAIAVAGAPASCGEVLLTRAHAQLSCKGNVLHVDGYRGPVGGAVVLVDPTSDAEVAEIPVRKRHGHFSYEGRVTGVPRTLELRAEVEDMSWVRAKPVKVHRAKCRHRR